MGTKLFYAVEITFSEGTEAYRQYVRFSSKEARNAWTTTNVGKGYGQDGVLRQTARVKEIDRIDGVSYARVIVMIGPQFDKNPRLMARHEDQDLIHAFILYLSRNYGPDVFILKQNDEQHEIHCLTSPGAGFQESVYNIWKIFHAGWYARG